ncbi:hypothetical protein ACIRPH_13835 [Nocardiopsis sp. NPDC101807]|uniref:hypothetical protein n=1 Tax=Nocardiopsis sp. NPDC101807 TaxID=3364339 RepID=UPI0037F45218
MAIADRCPSDDEELDVPRERIPRYGTLSVQAASEQGGTLLHRATGPERPRAGTRRRVDAARRREPSAGPQR